MNTGGFIGWNTERILGAGGLIFGALVGSHTLNLLHVRVEGTSSTPGVEAMLMISLPSPLLSTKGLSTSGWDRNACLAPLYFSAIARSQAVAFLRCLIVARSWRESKLSLGFLYLIRLEDPRDQNSTTCVHRQVCARHHLLKKLDKTNPLDRNFSCRDAGYGCVVIDVPLSM